jgi:hypothetical protein
MDVSGPEHAAEAGPSDDISETSGSIKNGKKV